MSKIPPSVVLGSHDYTRSKVPWRLDANLEAHGETSSGRRFGWKLFHYLAGGGMRTFGRTVQQEELLARQNRFLALAAVAGALWLVLYLT
ncbi:MAG: hypothetical protein IJ829_05930 [Kiritimatiellae bacterium]|nr:hypothetical protein [Kiritimatiellia bacterium]